MSVLALSELTVYIRELDTLSGGVGGNSVKVYFTRFWKGVYSKRKEFALLGSKFFPLRVDFFSQGLPLGENSFI